jgi:hypothetical protein
LQWQAGLPILPNLLRYEILAVADYGCISHVLHLRQTRQSLNLGNTRSPTVRFGVFELSLNLINVPSDFLT